VNAVTATLSRVGARVMERGWLSSNGILFAEPGEPAVLVDTGYAAHAEQTVGLLESILGDRRLDRIINTHLHSDHCGGNAALQARYGCEVVVPQASLRAAREWDMRVLSFEATGQRCERFAPSAALDPGGTVSLSGREWEVHACGGHDADAVVLFEPRHRVLISGDALWEHRLAIVFEALDDPGGFDAVLESLSLIERLAPEVVIPGHGPPFADAVSALAQSRMRLQAFRTGQLDHTQAARRSLLMFHLLEHRRRSLDELRAWAGGASLFRGETDWVTREAAVLVQNGLLCRLGDAYEVS
jgi:glyoxylase-like metal-dependent hydrolase (beta-lactamase superfamily II)